MDAMISEILTSLQERETSQYVLDITGLTTYDETVLLRAKYIVLVGVHYGHIQLMRHMDNQPFISFLHMALAYGCQITIQMSPFITSLMNPRVIVDWPISFVDRSGKRLYSFKESWIHGALVKTCESESTIILCKGQRLTAAAQDIVEQLQVQVIEGNE